MISKSLFAFLLLPLCFLQAIPEIAGPISGDVRANQVTLWMYAPLNSKCTYSYHAEGASGTDKKRGGLKPISNQAAKGMGQVFKSTLVGLSPNTDHPDHHHMRIDYVYFKGEGIQVTEAKIIGEKKENADIVVSPYPSDHRAVVSTFSLAH
jgi:hypothetical protein